MTGRLFGDGGDADAPVATGADPQAPLAARLRPRTLDEVVGQRQLVGPGAPLRRAIESDALHSAILWGPPGSGKTSVAHVVAESTRAAFVQLSAVTAGVRDVRTILDQARARRTATGRATVLFVDEIHRFNKAQQDVLLPAVEDGSVVLIGATTQNPYFEVVAPLLSRSLLYRLEPLAGDDVATLLRRALSDPRGLPGVTVEPDALAGLVAAADGDARVGLTALEVAAGLARPVTVAAVRAALARPHLRYDRAADQHYDQASALIKSLRGSDPDAAVYWLVRMLESGEDPRFVARRLVILASEDVGLADPDALQVAVAAAHALELVGLPEARFALAQAAVYLALAPKSNSITTALGRADAAVARLGNAAVPAHLRDAHYKGAARLGHGAGYRYPHDDPGGWVDQRYLPEGLEPGDLYRPGRHGREPGLARHRPGAPPV
ncbi:MAG TPA: replication-associated recombination protein A [Egibacteraceae bacterium]|nr:replication-associated recombination protein A [Egibacteraceae bacterium]